MPATLYGFSSCDTVKKARAWLDARGAPYEFHDYRVKPLDPGVLDHWFQRAGWEAVLNRNSTTFRELPDTDKAGIDARRARAMILAETNLIKRPVFEFGDALLFGFREKQYEAALTADH
jgi:arsenate reductase (glutaredoxin)